MARNTQRLKAGRSVALLVLVYLIVLFRAYATLLERQADPDLFWHLATGRYIITHHEIPTRDVFSWYGQEHGLPWVTEEWLFEVLLYGVWFVGGFRLIFAFTALVEGLLFLLVYWLARIRGGSPLGSLLIATAMFVGIWPYLAPRPQMLTYCLLAATAILLEKNRWYWVLPILLFEMNSHGGVWPIYLVLIAYYAIPGKPALLVAAGTLVVFNPHGLAMIPYPFRTLFYGGVGFVQEWMHLALADNWFNLAAYFVFFLRIRNKFIPIKEGLLALVLVVLGFTALRHVPFFYTLVLPMMAPYLAPSESKEVGIPERRLRVLEVALAAVLGVAVVINFQRILPLNVDVNRQYPKDALAYIRSHGLQRIFNVWEDGGYLIYNGVPPLIDGRGDPFIPAYNGGDDIMGEYASVFQLRADWHTFLEKHRIRYLLLGKGLPFYLAIRHAQGVSVLYDDERFAVLDYSPDLGP